MRLTTTQSGQRSATTTLHHPDASIRVTATNSGKREILVEPDGNIFVLTNTWQTSYDLDLIEHALQVKGPAYLCDEIKRDEDPRYVQHDLHWDICSYVRDDAFSGRRILDFGCGCGASSMVLARMFSTAAEIVGVELVPEHAELAEHRARFYGVENRVTFLLSPDPNSLPPAIGQFDCIVLSAVYEHLLPDERPMILSLLWAHLKPMGVMFLNQTPYRWFPIERHTTGLPLINYLPARLALACARRLSNRVQPNESWDELLRKGIRGGTIRQIMRILNQDGRKAEILRPSQLGVTDRLDLWYSVSGTLGRPLAKKVFLGSLRIVKALTGLELVPSLSLAIRKIA